MESQTLAESGVALVAAVIPVLAVGGVFMAWSYTERRKKEVTKDEEKIYAALDKLWPLVTPDVAAAMISQQPASYFLVSKLMAERRAAKTFKEM